MPHSAPRSPAPQAAGPHAAIVVLAAGSGTRVGAGRNKVLLDAGGSSIVARAVATALAVAGVARVLVVVRDGEQDDVAAQLAPVLSALPGEREVVLVPGGATRHLSERAALAALAEPIESGEIDVVALHDAARCAAPAELFETAIETARAEGGAVPVVPAPALVARAGDTVGADLEGLGAVQTPQAFAAAPLAAAFAWARTDGDDAARSTDTAGCVRAWTASGGPASDGLPPPRVVAIAGRADNLKVTYPDDLDTLRRLALSAGRSAPRAR